MVSEVHFHGLGEPLKFDNSTMNMCVFGVRKVRGPPGRTIVSEIERLVVPGGDFGDIGDARPVFSVILVISGWLSSIV